MTIPDPRAAQAYRLYVVDGLSVDAVRFILHAGRRNVRRWIVERGGEIRPPSHRGASAFSKDASTPRTKRSSNPVCSIGHWEPPGYAIGGGWYCSGYCEDDDRCKEPATVQNLWNFAKLGEKREADDKLIAERKAAKLSGNALWQGVRGDVKWR